VNDAPVAHDQAVATDEDIALPITLTATDVEGDALTFTIVASPAHGVLTGTGANVTYTPAPDYHGPDSFTFTANDGQVDSNTATIAITVRPVNDAPVAHDQSLATDEDTPLPIVLTASDIDGDVLVYAILTPPQHGTLTGTGGNLTYTPAADYNGPDRLHLQCERRVRRLEHGHRRHHGSARERLPGGAGPVPGHGRGHRAADHADGHRRRGRRADLRDPNTARARGC
jgi:hypothetical protein